MGEVSAFPTGTAPKRGADSPRTPGGTRRPRSGQADGLGLSATSTAEKSRFAPGELLSGRYRIIGLLGRGGMGEVYRAADLTLNQPVALKFLPERLVDDPDRLGRFFNEARVAREITHPSVCRVHDIGDVDGQPFLSMEYVDGENLSSLLRRIGRLPSDKTLDIARQICAGVAAAHDKGVLHRDLKPDNIMLDGRGRVRITDFGLAGLAEDITSAEVSSGTPAYMAPEQLAGREVTVRSDVYALGLVLYELFTGRRTFDGKSLAELTRMHLAEDPKPPSELVPDLDPAIERVILRCLAKEPATRPPSALRVSAALPGGDPLAAALAAGETPSPEMVAAAGQEGGLRAAQAWPLLLATLVGALASVGLGEATRLTHLAPHDKSPAVLEDRSRDLLEELGASETVADSAHGLFTDADFLFYRARRDASADRWRILEGGKPPVSQFWYRQSPRPLVSVQQTGSVSDSNPPADVSDMSGVWLDFDGRLVRFYAVPPQLEDPPPANPPEPDWERLFELAELDMLPVWLGLPPGPPTFSGQEFLLGSRPALGIILGTPANSVATSLGFLLLLFVLRVLLRRERLAAVVLVVLSAATVTLFNEFVPTLLMPMFLITWAIPAVVVLRLGLLALVCSFFTYQTLFIYPLGLGFSHWTGATTPIALLAVGTLAGWGFWVSLAGRPLVRDSLLDE